MAVQTDHRLLAAVQRFDDFLDRVRQGIGGDATGMHYGHDGRCAGIIVHKPDMGFHVAQIVPVATTDLVERVLGVASNIDTLALRVPSLVVIAGYGVSADSVTVGVIISEISALSIKAVDEQ